jgi:5-carboxymethyl-2-hydroxymuconate isomerase
MPHLRIEYSTNIAARFDGAAVARAACDALLASGVFNPPDSIKVRLVPVEHFRVGSGADHGFLHADLGMLSGRDAATKLRVTDALVQAIAPLVQPGPQVVQVTSEARDMDRDCYSKRLIPSA